MSDDKKKFKRRYQRFIAVCYVLKDAEPLKQLGSGERTVPVSSFFAAFGPGTSYDNEEPALTVQVKFKQAEFAVKHVRKGMELLIEGTLCAYRYTPQGVPKEIVGFRVACERIEVVKWNDNAKVGGGPQSDFGSPSQESASAEAKNVDPDVPF
jgi:hypothetical protein